MFRIFTVLAACLFTSVAALAQQVVDRPLLIGRVSVNQSPIAFSFERDATNKVVAIIVTLPNGRVIKARKT
jgi:hypothetical protein